jgi:hypothetical protein
VQGGTICSKTLSANQTKKNPELYVLGFSQSLSADLLLLFGLGCGGLLGG